MEPKQLDHITAQHPPPPGGAYGSSRLSICKEYVLARTPDTWRSEGSYISPFRRHHKVLRFFVRKINEAGAMISILSLTAGLNSTHSCAAWDTGILRRSRSSFSRTLSSCSLLSFSSAMVCFLFLPSPLSRVLYADVAAELMVCDI